ncbi:uncharacterized protein PITG_04192 [Phytophthora infestans T30-4]|uniref:Uncharacterized protein n=1 Tax=Phytophthora infestans (strain T30-4) TaxID=403677 RepID=D0N0R6_PHYIT|nr:uncharacterized protein PITG_04192 [Phytophthora infestans T30-4]EEY67229.1 conserved hypothetical protein [Phytophthora infestans T30-4]|eukprot:XP_002905877.1 conserved hypothetical protein [Phytophthora infestans T30-4]
MSSGLQFLDQLAEDILNGRTDASLQGTVVALPAPSDSAPSSGSATASTTSSGKQSKSPFKRTPKSPKSPARGKRKSSGDDSTSTSSAKKDRVVSKLKKSNVPSSEFGHLLDVSRTAPAPVRRVIAAILAKAEALGKKPWRLAYPWTGRPMWYDPIKFSQVYRAHWRFCITHRRAFWEWALHAPLATAAAMTQRRKLKMRAVQSRWAFTCLCIETWGFYAFLERLEKRPEMYWIGGQPGRATRDGRPYNGFIAEDLATLKQKDKERYDATLENALDPSTIDTYGYPSMRSLFESTDALSPAADEKSRLSLAALARARRDIMSSTKPNVTGAGEANEKPWQTLVNDHAVKPARDDIMAQINAGTYEVPAVRPPSSTERRRDEWSEFEDEGEDEEKEAAGEGDDAAGYDDEESEAADDEDEQEGEEFVEREDGDEEIDKDEDEDDLKKAPEILQSFAL